MISLSSEKFSAEGIMKNGYGFIPKLIMRDKDLSIEAKAIYSYLSSYTGAGHIAYPSVSLMCGELKISEARFYKHRKQLEEKGYIVINKHRDDNGWQNNVYTLPFVPTPQNLSTQNLSTQNLSTQNMGTNSNSLKSNSLKSNSSILSKKAKEKEYSMDLKEKKKKEVKHKYGEFDNVLLTDVEYNKLQERFPHDLKSRIERLSGYVASTGKSYKSHYATVINWAKKDKPEDSRSVSVLDKIKQME